MVNLAVLHFWYVPNDECAIEFLGPSSDPLTSKSEENQGRKMENYQKMEKIGEGRHPSYPVPANHLC